MRRGDAAEARVRPPSRPTSLARGTRNCPTRPSDDGLLTHCCIQYVRVVSRIRFPPALESAWCVSIVADCLGHFPSAPHLWAQAAHSRTSMECLRVPASSLLARAPVTQRYRPTTRLASCTRTPPVSAVRVQSKIGSQNGSGPQLRSSVRLRVGVSGTTIRQPRLRCSASTADAAAAAPESVEKVRRTPLAQRARHPPKQTTSVLPDIDRVLSAKPLTPYPTLAAEDGVQPQLAAPGRVEDCSLVRPRAFRRCVGRPPFGPSRPGGGEPASHANAE